MAIDGRAVMLSGPSGAGKSDLGLRLIDRGGVLIADDQVWAEKRGAEILLSPPSTIEGLIEVRELGIMKFSFVKEIPLSFIIQLTKDTERLPEANKAVILGMEMPLFELNPFTASAPIKVELLLRRILNADE